ncbi:MAG: HPr family phosphocarrier protein [Nitrospinota bacterium]
MVQAEVVVENRLGLHARPAATFVKITNRYDSEITVSKDDLRVNGKSIMGVMTLGASQGSRLLLRAEGEDAENLIRELAALVQNKFNEEL